MSVGIRGDRDRVLRAVEFGFRSLCLTLAARAGSALAPSRVSALLQRRPQAATAGSFFALRPRKQPIHAGACHQLQEEHARHPIFAAVAGPRPNPSLNHRTRYGSHRLAAPGPGVNCPSAAKRRLPPRSG